MTTIGYSAFESCSSLATIDIPASVTRIGNAAFSGCTNLTTVTLHSNPYIDYDAFPSGAMVTMNLTANLAGGAKWMTFYNENYSFQADVDTDVFTVYLDDIDLEITPVDGGIVPKGNAVVLKSKSTGNPVMTMTTAVNSSFPANNSLIGVSNPGSVTSQGNMYVLNDGTQGVGFYKLTYGKTLGVGKAYLQYGDPEPGPGGAREFFGFGDTTSINDVKDQKEDVRGEYYDLQGRRVSQPTKGLYIVNGKKVVIK